jgi:enoyl-[acyl-carrier-protein] reductase (NADH)
MDSINWKSRERHDDIRESAPDIEGREGPGHWNRQRAFDRVRVCQGISRARSKSGNYLCQRKNRPYTEPLARELKAALVLPLDVAKPEELDAVFAQIEKVWGKLDILVHSIAWAPKEDLQGGLLDCSAEGFAKAMDISCFTCAFLNTPYARRLSGETLYVDDGVNIMS